MEVERELEIISQCGQPLAVEVLRSKRAVRAFLDGVVPPRGRPQTSALAEGWTGAVEPTIHREELTDEGLAQLIAALDAELLRLNPRLAEYSVGIAREDLGTARGVMLVARIGTEPVGCGAVTMIEPHVAKIKRMYVPPEHRSHGIATRVLSALEAEARVLGATKVVLETATHLTSAIALYQRAGYTEVPQFGPYVGSDISLCMAKALDSS